MADAMLDGLCNAAGALATASPDEDSGAITSGMSTTQPRCLSSATTLAAAISMPPLRCRGGMPARSAAAAVTPYWHQGRYRVLQRISPIFWSFFRWKHSCPSPGTTLRQRRSRRSIKHLSKHRENLPPHPHNPQESKVECTGYSCRNMTEAVACRLCRQRSARQSTRCLIQPGVEGLSMSDPDMRAALGE